jgi:hypothetical protein
MTSPLTSTSPKPGEGAVDQMSLSPRRVAITRGQQARDRSRSGEDRDRLLYMTRRAIRLPEWMSIANGNCISVNSFTWARWVDHGYRMCLMLTVGCKLALLAALDVDSIGSSMAILSNGRALRGAWCGEQNPWSRHPATHRQLRGFG